MKKDKQRLKESIASIGATLSLNDILTGNVEDIIARTIEMVDELEDYEMKEEQAWEVIAKERNMNASEAEDIFNDNFAIKTFNEIEQESGVVERYKVLVHWLMNQVIELRKRQIDPKDKKVYRFTLNAFHEVDISAESEEAAREQAEKEWKETFGNMNTFGGPEFEKEVTE